MSASGVESTARRRRADGGRREQRARRVVEDADPVRARRPGLVDATELEQHLVLRDVEDGADVEWSRCGRGRRPAAVVYVDDRVGTSRSRTAAVEQLPAPLRPDAVVVGRRRSRARCRLNGRRRAAEDLRAVGRASPGRRPTLRTTWTRSNGVVGFVHDRSTCWPRRRRQGIRHRVGRGRRRRRAIVRAVAEKTPVRFVQTP